MKSAIDERLTHLTESGICSCETAQDYAEELKKLAGKTMSIENADRRSKVFKALADEKNRVHKAAARCRDEEQRYRQAAGDKPAAGIASAA
jgi:hypothetical protein